MYNDMTAMGAPGATPDSVLYASAGTDLFVTAYSRGKTADGAGSGTAAGAATDDAALYDTDGAGLYATSSGKPTPPAPAPQTGSPDGKKDDYSLYDMDGSGLMATNGPSGPPSGYEPDAGLYTTDAPATDAPSSFRRASTAVPPSPYYDSTYDDMNALASTAGPADGGDAGLYSDPDNGPTTNLNVRPPELAAVASSDSMPGVGAGAGAPRLIRNLSQASQSSTGSARFLDGGTFGSFGMTASKTGWFGDMVPSDPSSAGSAPPPPPPPPAAAPASVESNEGAAAPAATPATGLRLQSVAPTLPDLPMPAPLQLPTSYDDTRRPSIPRHQLIRMLRSADDSPALREALEELEQAGGTNFGPGL